MNFPSPHPLHCFVILLCFLLQIYAKNDDYTVGTPKPTPSPIREYTFYLNYTQLAPDGFSRRVWTVNGQYPGPEIHMYVGETLKVNVINGLQEPTSIHWHGLFQEGTPWFDGATGITQCPIAPGKNLTYEFKVTQSGTYWWHSHFPLQYIDGILGAFVVHDPKDPYLSSYDEEFTVINSWWYHKTTAQILSGVLTAPPEPDGGLINGRWAFNCTKAPAGSTCTPNAPLSKFKVAKGKKYRLRIINTSADGLMNFSIDKHVLNVIEVDGYYVKSYKTHRITTSPGQRYSVIVEADQEPADYFMRADLADVVEVVPLDKNVTAIFHYENAPQGKYPKPDPWDYSDILDSELVLRPYYTDNPCPSSAGQTFLYHVNITIDPDGPHGRMNGSAFTPNFTAPTLEKGFDDGFSVSALNTTGQNLFTFDKHGEYIDILLENDSGERHPFHLHGHKFWVVAKGDGPFPGKSTVDVKDLIQRDTSRLPAKGFLLIRFLANNPGVWGFHCHIEWHAALGMVVQFLELPSTLKTFTIPASVKALCAPPAK